MPEKKKDQNVFDLLKQAADTDHPLIMAQALKAAEDMGSMEASRLIREGMKSGNRHRFEEAADVLRGLATAGESKDTKGASDDKKPARGKAKRARRGGKKTPRRRRARET